jgi:hypothetical protein
MKMRALKAAVLSAALVSGSTIAAQAAYQALPNGGYAPQIAPNPNTPQAAYQTSPNGGYAPQIAPTPNGAQAGYQTLPNGEYAPQIAPTSNGARVGYQTLPNGGYPPQIAPTSNIPYANAPQPGPTVGSNRLLQSPPATAGGSQTASGSFYSKKGFGPAPN